MKLKLALILGAVINIGVAAQNSNSYISQHFTYDDFLLYSTYDENIRYAMIADGLSSNPFSVEMLPQDIQMQLMVDMMVFEDTFSSSVVLSGANNGSATLQFNDRKEQAYIPVQINGVGKPVFENLAALPKSTSLVADPNPQVYRFLAAVREPGKPTTILPFNLKGIRQQGDCFVGAPHSTLVCDLNQGSKYTIYASYDSTNQYKGSKKLFYGSFNQIMHYGKDETDYMNVTLSYDFNKFPNPVIEAALPKIQAISPSYLGNGGCRNGNNQVSCMKIGETLTPKVQTAYGKAAEISIAYLNGFEVVWQRVSTRGNIIEEVRKVLVNANTTLPEIKYTITENDAGSILRLCIVKDKSNININKNCVDPFFTNTLTPEGFTPAGGLGITAIDEIDKLPIIRTIDFKSRSGYEATLMKGYLYMDTYPMQTGFMTLAPWSQDSYGPIHYEPTFGRGRSNLKIKAKNTVTNKEENIELELFIDSSCASGRSTYLINKGSPCGDYDNINWLKGVFTDNTLIPHGVYVGSVDLLVRSKYVRHLDGIFSNPTTQVVKLNIEYTK
ncbi:MAG: hypothetical protein K2X04_09620 [Burkholderiales bacterium]|nr:hypothetical protein [Burkholderiales bacterium]